MSMMNDYEEDLDEIDDWLDLTVLEAEKRRSSERRGHVELV